MRPCAAPLAALALLEVRLRVLQEAEAVESRPTAPEQKRRRRRACGDERRHKEAETQSNRGRTLSPQTRDRGWSGGAYCVQGFVLCLVIP